MSVNMGQAVGYLDLDTSKFKTGFKSALADLKTFQSQTATSKDKLAAFSSAATSAGKSLTKGLTVPIAGIGAASVAVTAKFDAGMSKVQAISGATGKEMEQLRAKAKEMGAQTKFSATESAEAFNYMAMAGWKTEDMLDGIEGIMNLAAASGEDLATTSDIVTDALTAFGLSAKDSTHFADVLAAASSNANTNVAMMGETFKYVAPVAGALGFSVEDVSTAIGLMANSGIKGSQAGTALRNLFTRLAKPTKESAEVMKQLGISVTDSSGKMKDFDTIMGDLRKGFAGLSEAQKTQAAAALAGQYGMSGLLAIVNSSDKDFNKLKDSIYNADGASQKMAETMMDNLPGAITLAKSALEGLGIRIGEVITPAIIKVVRAFTSFISWLSQASDGTVRFAVAMGVILASIGPVLLITGTLARNVLSLIDLYNVLSEVMVGKAIIGFIKTAAAKAKDAAMTVVDTVANSRYLAALRGGLGVISGAISKVLALAAAHKIAAIAALGIVGAVVGLILYMRKTGMSVDELKDKVTAMFNNLVKQIPEIMDTVLHVASGIVRQIPTIISGVFTNLGTIVRTGLSNLKTALPEIAKWWENDMPQLIAVGSEMIVNIINGFAKALPDLINTGSDMIVQMIDEFSAQAPKFIDAISKILTNNVGPILVQILNIMVIIANSIAENLPVILQALTTIIIALIKAIADNAPAIIAAALKLMLALAAGILQALPQIIVAVAKIDAALLQAILAIVGAMVSAGIKILQALWRGIQSWASTLTSKVKGVGKRILRSIISGIGNLLATGRSWIMGLWNGIKSRFGRVTSGVRSFARGLPGVVKGALGSLFSAGANFIQGLWNGMSSKIGGVISGLRSKLSTVAGLARSIFKLGSPSRLMFQYGVWFMEGLENGIDKAYKPLLKGLKNHMEEIVSVYNPLTDYDFGIGESMDNKILQALGDISAGSGESAAVGNTITQNITVDGAENPEDFAERLARQLKISMRTV